MTATLLIFTASLLCTAAVHAAEPDIEMTSNQDSEVALPDTPAGRTFAAFAKAINSGKLETMKRFHTDFNGDPGNAEQDMGFFARSGGFRAHRIVMSAEHRITVLIKTINNGDWLNFEMEVEPSAPHGPISIRVTQGSAPGQ